MGSAGSAHARSAPLNAHPPPAAPRSHQRVPSLPLGVENRRSSMRPASAKGRPRSMDALPSARGVSFGNLAEKAPVYEIKSSPDEGAVVDVMELSARPEPAAPILKPRSSTFVPPLHTTEAAQGLLRDLRRATGPPRPFLDRAAELIAGVFRARLVDVRAATSTAVGRAPLADHRPGQPQLPADALPSGPDLDVVARNPLPCIWEGPHTPPASLPGLSEAPPKEGLPGPMFALCLRLVPGGTEGPMCGLLTLVFKSAEERSRVNGLSADLLVEASEFVSGGVQSLMALPPPASFASRTVARAFCSETSSTPFDQSAEGLRTALGALRCSVFSVKQQGSAPVLLGSSARSPSERAAAASGAPDALWAGLWGSSPEAGAARSGSGRPVLLLPIAPRVGAPAVGALLVEGRPGSDPFTHEQIEAAREAAWALAAPVRQASF